MKKKYNITVLQILVVLFAMAMSSCDEVEIIEEAPDQLFRPVLFTIEVLEESVEFSWAPIANASYQLELSKDSLLFQNDLKSYTIEGESLLNVIGLEPDMRYSARIKAVSSSDEIKDSEYKELTFLMPNEDY